MTDRHCSACSKSLVWITVPDGHKLVCPRPSCTGHEPTPATSPKQTAMRPNPTGGHHKDQPTQTPLTSRLVARKTPEFGSVGRQSPLSTSSQPKETCNERD